VGRFIFGKNSLVEKRSVGTGRCLGATVSIFVAKVRGEFIAHFHTAAVIFLFTCLAFSVLEALEFPRTAHDFFPEHLSNQFQGLRRTFSEIFTKIDAVPLSDPLRIRIRPDTRLQIKGRKNSAPPPSCVNVVH
jgi:hypothetical protein